MISYKPFWETVKARGLSWNRLVQEYDVNPGTLSRIRNNKPITTETMAAFCKILNCDISDIVRYEA